jgi:hypothetical protein
MDPGRRVDQHHRLPSAPVLLQFLDSHQFGTTSRSLSQFSHSVAAIEFGDCCNDGFALGPRPRKTNSILELIIWNINACFHDSNLSRYIF